MELTVYHLKTCDTCRKAIKALSAAGHTLSLVDVRADGIPPDDLRAIATNVGWETLLNTRSTTWRGLSENEKSDMDATKALDLMQAHPTLIKRPVIMTGSSATVGWTATVQDKYLS